MASDSVCFQALFFNAGGLVLSHVSPFPFRCSCCCKGAELLSIQRALAAGGHSIFQSEERVARYSRCVPLLRVSRTQDCTAVDCSVFLGCA